MKKAIREHLRDFMAILMIVVAGVATTLVILVNQRADFPEWFPGLGKKTFEMSAEFSTAQAVTPGQGQSVDIAGVRVGEVTGVEQQDGTAVVTVEVEEEYSDLIHRDASILLRPKTGLNDMVLALDPGTEDAPQVTEGETLPLSQTEPNVNPDEFLTVLDTDTRDYLKLLLAGGAEGFGGVEKGRRLGDVMRRFEPAVRDIGLINKGMAARRTDIAEGIHNFGLVSAALAESDDAVADFVTYSDQALAGFAAQESSLRAAIRELPGALKATRNAVTYGNEFSLQAKPALTKSLPGAKALAPALRELQPFFTQTVGPLQTQVRPFTQTLYGGGSPGPIKALQLASQGLGYSTEPLKSGLTDFNSIFNALAYNPENSATKQSYLFWLQWLNRNTNSTLSLEDANGPLGRATALLDCNTRFYAQSVEAYDHYLSTVIALAGIPTIQQIGRPNPANPSQCIAPF
ncbi:MAG: MlaD family protein [bacterium]